MSPAAYPQVFSVKRIAKRFQALKFDCVSDSTLISTRILSSCTSSLKSRTHSVAFISANPTNRNGKKGSLPMKGKQS